MLQLLVPLCLSLLPQSQEAAARQARVECLLTPQPWVEGHCFSMQERMAALNVPGVSLAVMHEGRIDWAAGYGVRDSKTGEPVTVETLFQAGSISKPVSAMAAHRLAQEGKLDLDAPINEALTSWQLPKGEFKGQVSARNILSHMGGLSVHGFAGYASFDEVPSMVQILDGAAPANSDAVRRIDPLESGPRYSGGGSTILQLAMSDVSAAPFERLLLESVLKPLKMTRSTFAQPLPIETWPNHAAGHGADGRPIAGQFRTHPERFAAGLWTTASDLARFAMEIQNALQIDEGLVLKAQSAQTMLSAIRPRMGQGVMLQEHDDEEWFGHGGANIGFRNDFRASFEGGRGVFILTNGENGSVLANEVLRAVARVYEWPEVLEPPLPAGKKEPHRLTAYVGRFGSEPDQVNYVAEHEGHLFLRQGAGREQRLAPLGKHRFQILGTRQQIEFQLGASQVAQALKLNALSRQSTPRMDEMDRWPIDDLLAGKLLAATDFYREVFSADDSDPMVSYAQLEIKATGLWNDQRVQAGSSLAQLLTEFYPEMPESWFTLAEMCASTGKNETAIVAYRKCLALLPAGGGDWLRRNSTSMLRGLER